MKGKTEVLDLLPNEFREMVKESYKQLKGKKFSGLSKNSKEDLKKVLEKLYWNCNLSLRKIALLFERDYDTIYKWFLKLKIKKRSHQEAINLRRNPSRETLLASLPYELKRKVEQLSLTQKVKRKWNLESKGILKTLYYDYGMSFNKLGLLFKISRSNFRRLFKKFKIKTRSFNLASKVNERERHKIMEKLPLDISNNIQKNFVKIQNRKSNNLSVSTSKLSKDILKVLYLDYKLSLKEIGMLFGFSQNKIRKRLRKYNIPIRSISEALTKYPKRPFIEDNEEMTKLKCYLVGLRCGDLYAFLDDKRVICSVSTTHPAWEKLMNDLFRDFGPIRKHPFENRKGEFAWQISAYLDDSFSFLISKLSKIPSWIVNNKQLFFNFLAGLIDSDGTIALKGKDRPVIRITSSDKWLMQKIKNILEKFNYHAVLYKKEKHNEIHFGKKPIYELEIGKKKEVMELLSQLSFKHEEKIKRATLILTLRKEQLTKTWKELINEIRSKRIEYQKSAKVAIKVKNH
jgi:hypothetical protein